MEESELTEVYSDQLLPGFTEIMKLLRLDKNHVVGGQETGSQFGVV